MYFRVEHTTRYRYTTPVMLSPHVFRLCPRGDAIRVARFDLQIHPKPEGLIQSLDAEGNRTYLAWFREPAPQLTVVSTFEARIPPSNPFEYVLTEPAAMRLPVQYAAHADALQPYCKPSTLRGPVVTLAHQLAEEAGGNSVRFLNLAAQHLSAFAKETREDGAPFLPAATLSSRSGPCRDLAVLYIELCRQHGLAARFVSGYWSGTSPAERRYLHAWAEVYLPGPGWRGYDPGSGLAVADDHVPLAATLNPEDAAPVQGAYAGESHIPAEMNWQIRIDIRPA